MMRCINWLEQHINDFFKLNGVLWLISIGVTIAFIYFTFGWMTNDAKVVTDGQQWTMFKTIWRPAIPVICISLLLSLLFFLRIYLIFPVAILYLLPNFSGNLYNITSLFQGFIHLNLDLPSFFYFILFISSLLGTILWGRRMYYKFYKK